MYEAFYGLREKPFNLTPDPKYLYLSEKHHEAFAHLLFGIKNRSGFVLVAGEIGTGKTTICRNLLNQLDRDTEVAFVFNPSLNPGELLKKVNKEFGIPSQAERVPDLVEELNLYLLEAAAKGKNCVLLIDEAQNLSPEVLEQIRLLSNLETETEKLLQIILIGQPELVEKLALKELRQLNQRITARYYLKPLSELETLQYIAYRLHVAGGRRKVRFERTAIRAIYKFSGGTPRVINALCDRALLIGYTKEAHTITPAIVKQAAQEIQGEHVSRRAPLAPRLKAWMPSPALIAAVALVLLTVYFIAPPLERLAQEWAAYNDLLYAATPAHEKPEPAPPNTANAITAEARPSAGETPAQAAPSPAVIRILEHLSELQPRTPKEEAVAAAEPPFVERLQAMDPQATRDAAANALVQAWELTPTDKRPRSDAVQDLAAFLAAAGLASEHLSPAVTQLMAIGLPAFVRMTAGERSLWMALTAVEEAHVVLSGETVTPLNVSREAFAEHYAGEALVPWRDRTPQSPVLMRGRSGSTVSELKERLRRLERLGPDNTSAQYDAATASAVSKIQGETGLILDGRAGKQVRMVLSSWLAEPGTPSLKSGAVKAAPALAAAAAPSIAEAVAATRAETPATPLPEGEAPEALPRPAVPVSGPVTAEADTPPEGEAPEALPRPAVPVSGPVTAEADTPSEAGIVPLPLGAVLPEEMALDEATATEGPPPVMVEVQELPEPFPEEQLPPAETGPLKERTPPALGSTPLVPHQNAGE